MYHETPAKTEMAKLMERVKDEQQEKEEAPDDDEESLGSRGNCRKEISRDFRTSRPETFFMGFRCPKSDPRSAIRPPPTTRAVRGSGHVPTCPDPQLPRIRTSFSFVHKIIASAHLGRWAPIKGGLAPIIFLAPMAHGLPCAGRAHTIVRLP
jgi:hypothetical protein